MQESVKALDTPAASAAARRRAAPGRPRLTKTETAMVAGGLLLLGVGALQYVRPRNR